MAWGLWVVCGAAGSVVALLFLLLADGMLQGQSVGKRIFGVKVMHLPTRSAARHRDSTLRNAPLALVVLLGMMPEPLGLVAGAAGLRGHRRAGGVARPEGSARLAAGGHVGPDAGGGWEGCRGRDGCRPHPRGA